MVGHLDYSLVTGSLQLTGQLLNLAQTSVFLDILESQAELINTRKTSVILLGSDRI